MIGSLPTQALAFLVVFVYATHATQAIAFEWKPGFSVWHAVRKTGLDVLVNRSSTDLYRRGAWRQLPHE